MSFKKEIFRACDVLGLYPEEINEKASYKIGRAFVEVTQAKKVAVGRDNRVSSTTLSRELIKGMLDAGADVYDLGLATSPMVYFASGTLDVDGAVVLTASHKPKEYNGMKFCKKDAVPIGRGTGLNEIRDLAFENKFKDVVDKGVVEKKDIKEDYLIEMKEYLRLKGKKFKLVIDTANAIGILELDLFRYLSDDIDLLAINEDLDNNFPSHEANPLKNETLKELQERVVREKADLGIAFDGDADRVGFVDELGCIVPMDIVTALVSRAILRENLGAKILYDLRSSESVREEIEDNGGEAIESRVGHNKVKEQMRESEAVFAGEFSGHYYFKNNFYAEAGSLPALYLLNVMADSGKTMSSLVKDIKKYYHSGEINLEVTNIDETINKLKERFSGAKITEIEGLKVNYWDNEVGKKWWFNVRSSNNEDVLRLTVEADERSFMFAKKNELLEIIRNENK